MIIVQGTFWMELGHAGGRPALISNIMDMTQAGQNDMWSCMLYYLTKLWSLEEACTQIVCELVLEDDQD